MPIQSRNPLPTFPRPYQEYNKEYIERLIRVIEQAFDTIYNPGAFRCSTINISQIPTTATGLRVGDVWNDSGTLKIVT